MFRLAIRNRCPAITVHRVMYPIGSPGICVSRNILLTAHHQAATGTMDA